MASEIGFAQAVLREQALYSSIAPEFICLSVL